MSNQIVITSGAKVRNLDGVLTGTSGIVGSVGFGTANGVATLDSSGKVPLSQLPASVITYLGTWNAATNTPTLTNGVGDVGDLYICNVAGTVNFGAGPITFAVGDWVIYSGTTWEKSGGASGTVTSVAMTVPTGLSVSGSPITTSGTLAVSLSSGYTIPTTSFLSGLVPYTGATQSVDLGAYDLNARGIKINGTGGLGHADFKHQSGTPTGSASSSTLYADTNGDIAWLNDHSHIITLSANSNTADRTYTFQDASGTLAFLTDIPSLTNYVTLNTAQTISGQKTFSAGVIISNTGNQPLKLADYATSITTTTGYTTIGTNANGFQIINGGGKGANFFFGSSTYAYYLPSSNGTIALTSDIPSLANYVTLNGAQTITGIKTFTNEQLFGNGMTLTGGYITYTSGSYNLTLNTNLLTANRNVYIKDGSGTLAFTSDIPSLSGYVQGSGTTNYHTKFTASGTIGNSLIYDNGTSVGVNTTSLTLKFNVAGDTYSSQGFFVQDSTNTFIGSLNNTSGMVVNGTTLATVIRSGGNNVLTLASTGAATFSSSVTAGGNIIAPQFYANFGGAGFRGLEYQNSGTIFGYSKADAGSGEYRHYIGPSSGWGGYMTFYTDNSERMRITSSGNVGIGTSSPSTKLTVYGGYANFTDGTVDIYSGSDGSGGLFGTISNHYQRFITNNTERMRITSGGYVLVGYTSSPSAAGLLQTTSAYVGSLGTGIVYSLSGVLTSTNPSDLRLKDNVEDLGYGLKEILQLRPVKYNWKNDNANQGKQFGFIAQEVQDVIPELVTTFDTEDGERLGLEKEGIYAALVQAIKELKAEIDELKNK